MNNIEGRVRPKWHAQLTITMGSAVSSSIGPRANDGMVSRNLCPVRFGSHLVFGVLHLTIIPSLY